jgi:hypothetical protein
LLLFPEIEIEKETKFNMHAIDKMVKKKRKKFVWIHDVDGIDNQCSGNK